MNRLWVRLSAAFSAVILISAAIIFISGRAVQEAAPLPPALDAVTQQGGLVDRLTIYYDRSGSWVGVEVIFGMYGGVPGMPRMRLPLQFTLRDSGERVVFSNADGADYLAGAIVLFNRTRPVGTLEVWLDGPPSDYAIIEPLVNALILIAVVGSSVGLIVSIWVSRGLTAPLERLADAARRLARRDLSQRVTVAGTQEIRDVATAFNDMADALQESERLRSNLIADVAHEIRTPLTVLQGNLRAIIDGVYALDREEVFRIYDQTRLLSRLVNDLHELALSDARQLVLHREQVDVRALVQGCVELFEPVAESAAIALTVTYEGDMPIIDGDPGRLQQVLNNLFVNAVRHTDEGGAIRLTVRRQGDGVEIVMRDTGEGIPAEHVPYVFERFYRVDSQRSRETGGTGLGLAIIRALVLAHGGTIAVTSSTAPVDHGTTFTIRLPIRAAAG